MLTRPRFRESFHVEVMEPEYVMLLTETQVHALEGRAYKELAPYLDGRLTVAELAEAVSDRVPAPEVYYAIEMLTRKGYLVESDGTLPADRAAFWSGLGVDAAQAAQRLQTEPVAVRGVGDVDTLALEEALAAAGVTLGEAGALTVWVTDDYARPALREVNREALAAERAWMLVKPVGMVLWIGPIFEPGNTGCWECLALRLRGNRHAESYVLAKSGRTEPLPTSMAALGSSVRIAAGLAATEIAQYVALARHERLVGRILSLDLKTLAFEEHVLTRRPQCPACGDPELLRRRIDPRVTLASRQKRFRSDGGHRVESPESSYARLKHHVSPITGIVGSLIRKDEGENGVTFSYAAGHDFPMLSNDLGVLKANLRFRSGGKGASDVQARVSGISESIERWSGVWRGDEPVVRATARALGDEAVPINDVLCFSERQFEGRHAWNHGCSRTHYHVVPEPFDLDQEIDWTAVWSLSQERVRYLPSAYCFYAHPDGKKFFCATDANGTSAGNTVEEAIAQGFLELVERDAVAIWWYNRLRRPRVDLDSFQMPYLDAFRAHHARIARECWVLDLTHDLGIPSFAGVSRRLGAPVEDVIVGFGAHLDARIALLRCLTEVNQFLPALSNFRPDGTTVYSYDDPDATRWWSQATVATEPYLLPDDHARVRSLADFPDHSSDDVAEDVRRLVGIAAAHGMETLVLDQTRPDAGQPVTRVVVPGLRHFWRRLGPGRLYDVPVRLGWLKTPTPEDQINPWSLFF